MAKPMFNMGWGEWTVIFFLILLLFGPKRLPEMARGLGRFFRQLQHGVEELKEGIEKEDRNNKG